MATVKLDELVCKVGPMVRKMAERVCGDNYCGLVEDCEQEGMLALVEWCKSGITEISRNEMVSVIENAMVAYVEYEKMQDNIFG